jgi:hypothetical protein
MKCEDVEKVLPELLDGAPDSAFQSEFEIHLQSCPDCSGLVSDLKLIASEARQLEATEEPAPRVWVRIAAELRAEGLIKDQPSAAFARPILVPSSPRRRWSAWWLAPIAATILAAGSYVLSHQAAPQITKQSVPVNRVISPAPVVASVPQAPAATLTPVPVQASKTVAQNDGAPGVLAHPSHLQGAPGRSAMPVSPADTRNTMARTASPAPSAEDQQFLSVVSTLSPSMRVTYENQLQAVNADIRETQAYVDRNPGDPDARQHLMDAYRQKELLYQIALDRIQ